MRNSEKIKVKKYFDEIYLEKNGIILDKICPVCKKAVEENEKYCTCGAFVGKKDRFHQWVILTFSFFISALLIFYLSWNYNFDIFSAISPENFQISSLSPLNIQFISALNDTPYKKYVQNIYTRPHEDNVIIILIRPSLWHMLKENDKKIILQIVKEKGEVVIKQKFPNLNKKVSVQYANAK